MIRQGESNLRFDGFALKASEPATNLGNSVSTLLGVPSGRGSWIGKVEKLDGEDQSSPSEVKSAKLRLGGDPIFFLVGASHGGVSGADPLGDASPVFPVAPVEGLGSVALLAALRSCSLPNLLEALASGVVLVPVVRKPNGELATRLFDLVGKGEGANSLCLFSSAEALEGFLGDDSERLFVIRQGASVVEYLGRHLDAVSTVMFDPAGPSPVSVAAALLPSVVKINKVAVDEIVDSLASLDSESRGEITGFDLNLDSNWGVIDMTDPARREQHIQWLITRQTRDRGDEAAGFRREMRAWLTKTAAMAAMEGGQQMGFLLARTSRAAAALSVTSYFHDLGPMHKEMSHLEKIAERLRSSNRPDQELVDIDVAGKHILRHIRTGRGDPRLGGGDVKLLLIDYWIGVSDDKHVAHVSFSTPHVGGKDTIVMLADNVVANGRWVTSGGSLTKPLNGRLDASEGQ